MKVLLLSLMLGILFAEILVAGLAPRLITWWYTPPADLLLNCSGGVKWATRAMQRMMLWSGMVGGIVGMLSGWPLVRAARKLVGSEPASTTKK